MVEPSIWKAVKSVGSRFDYKMENWQKILETTIRKVYSVITFLRNFSLSSVWCINSFAELLECP